jgi:hypothetical protein
MAPTIKRIIPAVLQECGNKNRDLIIVKFNLPNVKQTLQINKCI